MIPRHSLRYALLTALVFTAATVTQANERRFSYTYESATLPKGARELEFWSTWRAGRANFYSRFDHRAEFEFGVTDRLMTAFYFDWHRTTQQDPSNPSGTVNEQEFEGIASEWKYKLTDPVADAVGLALYQEYAIHSDEFKWESKIIADKKFGKHLLAYNLVIEPEWEFRPGGSDYEIEVEHDLAYSYFFSPRFSAGLEIRNHGELTKTSTGFEHNALFVGPAFSYAQESWWITGTILRQLPAIKRSLDNPQDRLVLDEHEKLNVRILASIRF